MGVYTWPNPAPFAQSFQEELDATKSWIRDRLTWVDANLSGTCYPHLVGLAAQNALAMKVYPNPSQGRFKISCSANIDQLTVTDMFGKVVYDAYPNELFGMVQLSNSGVYIVQVKSGDSVKTQKITVLN